MYLPAAYVITDPAKIAEIISANSFAMLVSNDGDSVFASHLPFLHEPEKGANGKLISHMAKANRHWRLFNKKQEALVIFNGPHAYISPNWYVGGHAVPTWNYATIHVYGIPRIMTTEAELNEILDRTVDKHESTLARPWTPDIPAELKAHLLQALVGFEIEITKIEAKFKLGQNRSVEDQAKMRQTLKASDDAESVRLANLMEREAQSRAH